jgi:hypothetical protein
MASKVLVPGARLRPNRALAAGSSVSEDWATAGTSIPMLDSRFLFTVDEHRDAQAEFVAQHAQDGAEGPTCRSTPALLSAAPLPHSRPSRSTASNGGLCQSGTSPTGWTS